MKFVSDADFTLHLGDVREVLRELPDASVDCIVTSPPYWGLRDYGVEGQLGLEPTPEAYVANMVEVFHEVRRVLAAHGTVWLNLGDSYAANRSYQVSQTRNPTHDFGASNATIVPDGLKPKDLVGIPWRVAFALQADGWYLRSDIVWSKPNPMPESVTDRPTKSHEYVFLLSKGPRYFFDQEAVREPAEWARWGDQTNGKHQGSGSAASWIPSRPKAELTGGRQRRHYDAEHFKTTDERNTRYQGPNPADRRRNVRSVWEIATQPFPEAHFATFPEALVERCIKAGCPAQVCRKCGKARERIVNSGSGLAYSGVARMTGRPDGAERRNPRGGQKEYDSWVPPRTLGFTDCGHDAYRSGIVLDPFMGSGTTALVARRFGRHSVGIELNEEYATMCARRLSQLSLFGAA